jgi:hypothetical protein
VGGVALQLVDAGNSLASAPVGDDAGEALLALVEGDELRARPVVEIERRRRWNECLFLHD